MREAQAALVFAARYYKDTGDEATAAKIRLPAILELQQTRDGRGLGVFAKETSKEPDF